jgi:hypothetical protein
MALNNIDSPIGTSLPSVVVRDYAETASLGYTYTPRYLI